MLPVVQESWNYFRHRSLGVSCPAIAAVDLTQPRARRRKSIKF
jgi:hypothetical protein